MTGWRKYWRPASLTFWSSVTPISVGVFMASVPLHGFDALAFTADNLTGNVGSYALINGGLVGIGLRAAL